MSILRCGVNEIDPAAIWNIDEPAKDYTLVIDDVSECGDFPLSLVSEQPESAWVSLADNVLTVNPMLDNGAVIGEYKI